MFHPIAQDQDGKQLLKPPVCQILSVYPIQHEWVVPCDPVAETVHMAPLENLDILPEQQPYVILQSPLWRSVRHLPVRRIHVLISGFLPHVLKTEHYL